MFDIVVAVLKQNYRYENNFLSVKKDQFKEHFVKIYSFKMII